MNLGGSSGETRAYLQQRLAALFELMFWSFVALIAFLWCLYHINPEIEPRLNRYVYLAAAVGIAIMAGLWRILLRRQLTITLLHSIDLFYASGCGVVIGGAALMGYDFRPSAYTCLMYVCFALLTRALVVPSTGWRTAIATGLAFLPTTIAAAILAVETSQELPGPAFFSGYLVVAIVAVALTAAGSRIIYGLRHEATVAQQLGQYRLVKKIGEGGMGTVYLARHMMLRRETAVKLVRPDRVGADTLERFEREVRHMSQLSHPNSVAVFDYGHSSDGTFYYAMEYLAGGLDLERLVNTYGPQPAARVVHILVQVCGALREAHGRNLIHRDIKPANIILCRRGGLVDVAKVVDYGLVKEVTGETGVSTQILVGTPAYLAPEAITDPATVGPGVDLYALGAVGYFLLTGRRVFEGSAVELCMQHVTDVPRAPSEVAAIYIPPALDAVIMRCLEKRPADRFATTAELATALAAAVPDRWTPSEARAWWHDLRAALDPKIDEGATTMSIDLQHRDPT